jgi:glycolate oxidase FAD binding subunit
MLSPVPSVPQLPGEPYALDGLTPRAALRPETLEGVSEALAWASSQQMAVVPWGGGTHQGVGNRLERYDLALLTSGLNRVLDHQPADLTLTVQAGMTLSAVQAHLAPYGQHLPLEAEDPDRATIGGLIATTTAGPLRLSAGTPRDLVLWVEAVQPDGTIVHGGAKVVKNVAGYDTPKLFIGSLGSVGVLTAVTFRIAPKPATAPTLLVGFTEPGAAEGLVLELASGRLSPSLLTLVKGRIDWGGPFAIAPWVLAVGADGPAATTDWQLAEFERLARAAGATALARLDGAASAQARRALMARRGSGEVGLTAGLLPSQVVPLLAETADGGFWQAFAEAANGLVHLEWDCAEPTWQRVAERVEALGGTWRLTRCPLDWKQPPLDVWGPARGDRFLMRRLKAALDPRGVLNPGRFAGG